ncbi:MAG TPA: hypothetical protein VGI81_05430 [Tepidisphaeraceae bacterium]|jgi:hypothetical protein
MTFTEAHAVLATAGVKCAPGLSAVEFAQTEARYGLRFPPDLREFLGIALPISRPWVDWRHAPEASIRERLDWPLEGIRFDIEYNEFWLAEWGPRPEQLSTAFKIARQAVTNAPTLIPICSHRYIPAEPLERGNPVFSVHQTDIIYYGSDLLDYLQNEFQYHFGRPGFSISSAARRIRFWSELAG